MNFPLFKIAEIASATRNFKSGVYSWEKISEIERLFRDQFKLVGAETGGWLWELVGISVFDLIERFAAGRLTQDEMLAKILADPAFSGKTKEDSTVRQELGNRMRAQSGKKAPPPEQVIEMANLPDAASKLSDLMVTLGVALNEFHNYVDFANRTGPEKFSDARTMAAFIGRVAELRAGAAKAAPESKGGTDSSRNEIMEYIRANPALDRGLTIEAFGATTKTQTNSEAAQQLADRCLAEQNEGGGVCVHSVHLHKVLGGISLFASVRGPKREHVATIKFEDGLVYEIKGYNNTLPASQLKISDDEKQAMRSSIKSYISKMLESDVVGGLSQKGEEDFANLMNPGEISRAIENGADNYSTILPSQKISPAQIGVIWSRIRDDKSRTSEFIAMAGNKNTPPAIQAELHALHDDKVDAALAKNENLDQAIHDNLILHKNRLVRHRALAHDLGKNKQIDQDEIVKMLESKDSKVIARAASSPLAPQEKLLELGMSPLTDPNIKSNLLINPGIKLETKQAIFETIPSTAQISILKSSSYGAHSADIQKLILPDNFKLPDDGEDLDIASQHAGPHLMARLALHEKLWTSTRKAICKNPDTDAQILDNLAHGISSQKDIDEEDFRKQTFSIIEHPKVTSKTLAELVKNPAAGRGTINHIISHPKIDSAVADNILRNPNTDSRIALNLIEGGRLTSAGLLTAVSRFKNDAYLLDMVAKNPMADSVVLNKILDEASFSEDQLSPFQSIIFNKNANEQILEKLSKDPRCSGLDLSRLVNIPGATREVLSGVIKNNNASSTTLAEVISHPESDLDILREISTLRRGPDAFFMAKTPKTMPDWKRSFIASINRENEPTEQRFPLFRENKSTAAKN